MASLANSELVQFFSDGTSDRMKLVVSTTRKTLAFNEQCAG
jgi:hypothetical protein